MHCLSIILFGNIKYTNRILLNKRMLLEKIINQKYCTIDWIHD